MGERASCPTGPRSTAIPPSPGTLKPLPWKPWRSLSNRPWPTASGRSIRWRRALAKSARPRWGARKTTSGRRCPLPVVGTPRRAGGDAPYLQLSTTSSAIRPSVDSSSVKSPVFWLVKTAITVGPPS